MTFGGLRRWQTVKDTIRVIRYSCGVFGWNPCLNTMVLRQDTSKVTIGGLRRWQTVKDTIRVIRHSSGVFGWNLCLNAMVLRQKTRR